VTGRTRLPFAGGVLVLALSGCASSPVLLDEGDFSGVERSYQNQRYAVPPGWTWCEDLSPTFLGGGKFAGSWFSFGDPVQAGAALLDRSGDGMTAERLAGRYEDKAELCAEELERGEGEGRSIEALSGLDAGAVGWRTETMDGEWGEYVLIPLAEWQLLAVGFSTDQKEPPVDLDELVDLAREGAEQFPRGYYR